MNPLNPEPYQVAKRIGDGRHPYLGDGGVFLPDGTPLLRRSRYGDWEPRPLEALVKALAPHDDDIEVMAWRCRRLAAIADYLNKGDKALAIISLLHLHLRGNPAEERGGLAKTSDAWTWEPRIAAGLEGAGEWVAEAVAVAARSASRLVLGPAGAVLSVLIPTNESHIVDSSVPGHPDLNYHYDEARLSVWRTDAQGNQTLLYSGWPEGDGAYRLKDGTVIGHTVGSTSAVLDGDALKSAPPVDGHLPVSVTGASTGNPCPPPLPDVPGGMSPRAPPTRVRSPACHRGSRSTFPIRIPDRTKRTSSPKTAAGPPMAPCLKLRGRGWLGRLMMRGIGGHTIKGEERWRIRLIGKRGSRQRTDGTWNTTLPRSLWRSI